jgi:hypothetical protein
MCSLTTDRQRTAMPESAVAPDIHQTFDVHLDALPQVAFDFAFCFKDRPDAAQLIFVQVPDASIKTDGSLI